MGNEGYAIWVSEASATKINRESGPIVQGMLKSHDDMFKSHEDMLKLHVDSEQKPLTKTRRRRLRRT
jgi:hypothetical protein